MPRSTCASSTSSSSATASRRPSRSRSTRSLDCRSPTPSGDALARSEQAAASPGGGWRDPFPPRRMRTLRAPRWSPAATGHAHVSRVVEHPPPGDTTTGSAPALVLVDPGLGEALGERPVALEEVAEHRRRREEVADEDRPPRQLVEHPLGEDHHRAEEKDLERGEEDHQREDEERLPLGARDEQRAEHADDDEREAVESRVGQHGGRRRRLAEQRHAQELRRPERLALDRVDREEPERDDGRPDQARDDALAQHGAPGADQGARERAVGAEEVPEHRDRGEQVADQDRPPHERPEDGPAERADHAEDEDLEGGEQDHEGDEQRRLALAQRQEARRDDAERDERQAVDHRVAEDVGHRDLEPDRRAGTPEDCAAEEPRRQEGPAAREVEEEEPHRDDDRADQTGKDNRSPHRTPRSLNYRRHLSSAPHPGARSRASLTP